MTNVETPQPRPTAAQGSNISAHTTCFPDVLSVVALKPSLLASAHCMRHGFYRFPYTGYDAPQSHVPRSEPKPAPSPSKPKPVLGAKPKPAISPQKPQVALQKPVRVPPPPPPHTHTTDRHHTDTRARMCMRAWCAWSFTVQPSLTHPYAYMCSTLATHNSCTTSHHAELVSHCFRNVA